MIKYFILIISIYLDEDYFNWFYLNKEYYDVKYFREFCFDMNCFI